MVLAFEIFRSSGRWESLCEEVLEWANAHVTKDTLVSISMSESGRSFGDTAGTIVVWYWKQPDATGRT